MRLCLRLFELYSLPNLTFERFAIAPFTMELVEVVHPETGIPTGAKLGRLEVIQQAQWCRSTNVFVVNHQGEVLCHQRSKNKERLPGVWYTHVGGTVGAGETFESNALKELGEEAGIQKDASDLIAWRTLPVAKTTRADNVRLWMRDYVVVHDAPIETIIPQPGEVEQFAWKSFNDVLASERNEPTKWNAGVHDFVVEYHCLRAALVVAHTQGKIELPETLHVWQPYEFAH